MTFYGNWFRRWHNITWFEWCAIFRYRCAGFRLLTLFVHYKIDFDDVNAISSIRSRANITVPVKQAVHIFEKKIRLICQRSIYICTKTKPTNKTKQKQTKTNKNTPQKYNLVLNLFLFPSFYMQKINRIEWVSDFSLFTTISFRIHDVSRFWCNVEVKLY